MNYVELLEKEITKKSFVNKQELKEYLDEAFNIVKSNDDIKKSFVDAGLFSEIDPEQKEFYSYYFKIYDKIHVSESNLNVDEVTSFTIEGKDFIKYRDKDGNFRVIEDNEPSKSYIEQIKEKQDSSIEFQINDGETNKQEILKSMKGERKEIELESTINVEYGHLSQEELENFKTIVNHEMFQDRNLVFNASENIYIDTDSGEVFYVFINEQNLREIRRANETYTLTDKKDEIEYSEDMSESVNESENPGIEYEALSDSDLYYMVENRNGLIPEEAVNGAKNEMERRKKFQENRPMLSKKEKPKQYILTPNKQSNGFTSFLMLTLITSIYGIGFLTYLYLLIK